MSIRLNFGRFSRIHCKLFDVKLLFGQLVSVSRATHKVELEGKDIRFGLLFPKFGRRHTRVPAEVTAQIRG